MQNLRAVSNASNRLLRFGLSIGALVFATGASSALGACSAALSASGGDASCAALTSCCVTIPGETTQTCQVMAQATKESASTTSCASLLQSYEAAGYCGGGDGGASIPDGAPP